MNTLTPCDIQDAVDAGIIMELNRTFLHPLGFTLQAENVNDIMKLTMFKTDDPEGISYRSDVPPATIAEISKRIKGFQSYQEDKHQVREKKLGYVVQDSISNQPEKDNDAN